MLSQSIQLTTRDVEDQILHRRQQIGVQYPQATDGTRSKLVTLENTSVYCDLKADTFVDDASDSVGTSADAAASRTLVLERFRSKALEPFVSDPRRDVFFAGVIWLKLDLSKPPATLTSPTTTAGAAPAATARRIAVTAVDIVTEALKLNVDFAQLSALTEELTRVTDFRKHTQIRQWRPSCVDRERVAPPVVLVSTTALLPIVPRDVMTTLAFPLEKQRRTKRWFRAMWQFATWCILVSKRKGNVQHVRFSMQRTYAHMALDDAARSRRYIDLYTRSLSAEALQMVMHGKKLLWTPVSPRKPPPVAASEQQPLDASTAAPPLCLPTLEPLTRAEQWELSDLVLHLPVPEQRAYRSAAEAALRAFKLKSAGAASPTKQLATDALQPPPPSPSAPLASPSAPSPDASATPITSVDASSPSASPSKTSTRLPDLPADYLANHHHLTRSATESVLEPKKSLAAASPPKLTQLHFASTNALLDKPKPCASTSPGRQSPTKTLSLAAAPPTASSPAITKQRWLQQVFIPAWVLNKRPPLLNWSIGPISLCIFRDAGARSPTKTSDDDSSDAQAPASPSRSSASAFDGASGTTSSSSRCEFLKIGIERSTGAVLICHAPPSFLLELRLGLVHATLFSPVHQRTMLASARNNSFASDYIKDPDDGFLYIGLTSSSSSDSVAPQTAFTRETHRHGQLWDIKGKLCVGPITIDYNELTLQPTLSPSTSLSRTSPLGSAALTLGGFTHTPTDASLDVTRVDGVDLASSTYFAIIRDVAQSWRELYRRYRAQKQRAVVTRHDDGQFYAKLLDPVASAALKLVELEEQRMAKRARLEKLLRALLLFSSAFDVELGGLDLTLSLLTTRVKQMLQTQTPQAERFGYEDVHVELPSSRFGLHNHPELNVCDVAAAGVRVQFRSTAQGLDAAIEFVLRRLMGRK